MTSTSTNFFYNFYSTIQKPQEARLEAFGGEDGGGAGPARGTGSDY